jgi:hypothetical protein
MGSARQLKENLNGLRQKQKAGSQFRTGAHRVAGDGARRKILLDPHRGGMGEHEDGDGLNLHLDSIPLSGRIVLRAPKEEEAE